MSTVTMPMSVAESALEIFEDLLLVPCRDTCQCIIHPLQEAIARSREAVVRENALHMDALANEIADATAERLMREQRQPASFVEGARS